MATEVRVPATGNTGEDVVLVAWHVTEGADVVAGQPLVTLETAKASVDVDAPVSGRVLRIHQASGAEVAEHAVLAVIGTAGEAATRAAGEAATQAATQAAGEAATRLGREPRPAISPRARILAERHAIDVRTLAGTGPGGRIIAGDVLAAHRAHPTPANGTPLPGQPSPQPVTAAPDDGSVVVPLTRARAATARRVQASLQTTAQLTLTRYADADRLLAYAARLREATDARREPRIGINDLLLYATARAVARHPEANAWFDWDGIRRFRAVHLGFAVDAGEALLVPVLREAQSLSPAALAAAAHRAIERARAGTLSPEELAGGTFTLTNLGGLGVHWFTPVLAPPQVCILGIGAVHRAHPEAPAQLPLSLTFDHRALDGADAARLLADVATSVAQVDVLPALC